MNRAARKYLRRVKKHLFCPKSLGNGFLRRLEDEILLRCEPREMTYPELIEEIGQPGEVAENFLAEADPQAVSRFAYARLKIAYFSLAVVLAAALSSAAVSGRDYYKIRQLASGARAGEVFVHPNGTECTVFWVRTNFRGQDVYWEYHSCIDDLRVVPMPLEADGTEPYATDLYFIRDGTTEHWIFGDDHFFWVKVREDV